MHRLLPLLPLAAAASSSSSWSQVSITQADNGQQPPPIMSAITGAFANGTQFLIFGGCTSSCCFAPIDAQWTLDLTQDLTQGTWSKRIPHSGSLTAMSAVPSARFGAASTVDSTKDILYAFGGQDSSQAFLGDLYKFEARTQEWTEIKPSIFSETSTLSFQRPPAPRAAASLSVVRGGVGGGREGGRGQEKHLVLIGGFGRQGAKEDEVWGLKLSGTGRQMENGWVRLVPSSSTDVREVEEGKEEGTPSRSTSRGLPARWHHVAVPVKIPNITPSPSSSSPSFPCEEGRGQKDALVIVGGSDATGQDHNEALLVEIDWEEGTYTWRVLAAETEEKEQDERSRPPVRQ